MVAARRRVPPRGLRCDRIRGRTTGRRASSPWPSGTRFLRDLIDRPPGLHRTQNRGDRTNCCTHANSSAPRRCDSRSGACTTAILDPVSQRPPFLGRAGGSASPEVPAEPFDFPELACGLAVAMIWPPKTLRLSRCRLVCNSARIARPGPAVQSGSHTCPG